jgi:hypothetical protein
VMGCHRRIGIESPQRIRGSSGAGPFEPFTEGIELVRPEVGVPIQGDHRGAVPELLLNRLHGSPGGDRERLSGLS